MRLRTTSRLLAAWLVIGAAACLHAQTTANSSLVVSMTVQSSISLVFVNGSGAGTPGTCSISGANTNAASINFGIASTAGDNQSCVTFATGGAGANSYYTLSNNVYVLVSQTNLSSPSYTLTAALGAAAPTGVTWTINSATLGTGTTTVTSSGTYGSNLDMPMQIKVQSSVAAGSLSENISFVATSN